MLQERQRVASAHRKRPMWKHRKPSLPPDGEMLLRCRQDTGQASPIPEFHQRGTETDMAAMKQGSQQLCHWSLLRLRVLAFTDASIYPRNPWGCQSEPSGLDSTEVLRYDSGNSICRLLAGRSLARRLQFGKSGRSLPPDPSATLAGGASPRAGSADTGPISTRRMGNGRAGGSQIGAEPGHERSTHIGFIKRRYLMAATTTVRWLNEKHFGDRLRQPLVVLSGQADGHRSQTSKCF
jgi:hypothetical protein